jgi:hypothetical protein
MNAAVKLGGFVAVVAAVFAASFGVGRVFDDGRAPEPQPPAHDTGHDTGHGAPEPSATGHAEPGPNAAAAHLPGGLLAADQGYALSPVADAQFAYRIVGPDGHAVTKFDVVHDRPMHLIVARRDLSGFRHVHPTMSTDGTWRIEAPFSAPGVWRAYADFRPTGGPALTLGIDVHRSGDYQVRPLPAPALTSTVDGYAVSLARSGKEFTFTVQRDGRPVGDLQPYLGSYGHLVALRQADLAYLHVHPERASAGSITFAVEVPSAGTYRLFLDFQHQGVVRTAEFTIVEGAGHAHG